MIDNLKLFVRLLTEEIKKKVKENAQVIWYDSVMATSGRLKWQDELNPVNKYEYILINSSPNQSISPA